MRIYCFSFLYVIVNWISLGFELLVVKKQHTKMSPWDLENYAKQAKHRNAKLICRYLWKWLIWMSVMIWVWFEVNPSLDHMFVPLLLLLNSSLVSFYTLRFIAAYLTVCCNICVFVLLFKTDKSQANHFQQLFHILLAMGHSWADR